MFLEGRDLFVCDSKSSFHATQTCQRDIFPRKLTTKPKNEGVRWCIGFMWHSFGSRGAAGVAPVRKAPKLPHVR